MADPTRGEYTRQEQQHQAYRRHREKQGKGKKERTGIAIKTEQELPREPLMFFPYHLDLRGSK